VQRLGIAVAVAAALCASPAAAPAAAAPATLQPPLAPPFAQIETGPSGGTLWQGLIRDPAVPALRRPTVVYLPPDFTRSRRYPVVFFLQGFPGSPYQFVSGLRLAATADAEIAAGAIPPFVAVIPPAGLDAYHGDWTGVWETYLVRRVVGWARRHLPIAVPARLHTLAGLSAGGYGAIDIGLRHPGLFGVLEAWSGYFRPLRAGALVHAGPARLAAHDPTLLARREAPALRARGVRVFLSSGTTHDRASAAAARAFSRELARLGVEHRLWLAPGGHDGALWREQLPAALAYALGGGARLAPTIGAHAPPLAPQGIAA